MIELKHVGKSYNRDSPDLVVALSDLSLTIHENSFVVVVGSNGSGKSTLLNIIAGTVRPDSGKILINGQDITDLKDYERSKWVARIFQNPLSGTSAELTILENFRLAALRTQPKKFTIGTGAKFRKLVGERISLLQLGLENKLDQPMAVLSGGQRQALTLLMATMPVRKDSTPEGSDETKILLMDEPTASLDPRTSELILESASRIIREFRLTVLFVTHHLKDALMYGDRILYMKEGKIARDVQGEAKSKLSVGEMIVWFE